MSCDEAAPELCSPIINNFVRGVCMKSSCNVIEAMYYLPVSVSDNRFNLLYLSPLITVSLQIVGLMGTSLTTTRL